MVYLSSYTHRSPQRLQIVITEQYAPKFVRSNLADDESQCNGNLGARISPVRISGWNIREYPLPSSRLSDFVSGICSESFIRPRWKGGLNLLFPWACMTFFINTSAIIVNSEIPSCCNILDGKWWVGQLELSVHVDSLTAWYKQNWILILFGNCEFDLQVDGQR